MLRRLAKFTLNGGYNSSTPRFDQALNEMAQGSQNILIDGTGRTKPFTGFNAVGGVTGSRVLMNVGDDYGGLGSRSDSEGVGSIFRVLGAWFFIGAGSLFKNGVDTSADASTTLQIKKVTSGSLGTTYQAGLAQPSAPIISAVTPPSGYSGKNNGVVSVKIARVRAATGARSNASLVSNIITTTNQSVAVTFPSVDVNGQDYWEVDVTKNGEGAIGNHFFLQEIPETVIAEAITASRVATNSTTIKVANGTLTSAHIGWQYTSSGDVTTYITNVGAADSGGAGQQEITLAAANGSTNTQNATFTRAVAGVTRTYVFEWKDTDIVGSDLAPTRDYPPPAAIFGGVLGDVVFVDGALGDTVDVTQYAIDNSISRANTTTTFRGNAIAVSDPSRPESFPPDNYLFTNDPPTALLPGTHGIYWRFSRNSLGVVRYVGGSPAITYERLWTGLGIENQKLCTLGAGGRLYAFTGSKGLVRLGINGEPDTAFAGPIHRDLDTATVTWLGYDGRGQYVLVGTTTRIFAFHEPTGRWCAPVVATNGAASVPQWLHCVTQNGQAIIAANDPDSSTYKLYNFNEAGLSVTAYPTFVTPWVRSEQSFDILSRVYVDLDAGASGGSTNLSLSISCNGGQFTGYSSTSIDVDNNLQNVAVVRPNVSNARSWNLTLTHNTANFEQVTVEGESSNITF
jgi:hypothetical protein